MKKIFLITLLVAMCFSFTACGSSEDEELYAERSIDGIAECLGYTDGKERLDSFKELSGALAAKEFANGEVIIYEFDPQSYEYKDQQKQSAICNGGFVLMLGSAMSDKELFDLIERFEKIKFK